VIDGPISDDIFWFDESVNDSGFLDNDDDHFSSGSSDDWGWDEWGDLVVFRPIGHEVRMPIASLSPFARSQPSTGCIESGSGSRGSGQLQIVSCDCSQIALVL
jgi:hypothetical protein